MIRHLLYVCNIPTIIMLMAACLHGQGTPGPFVKQQYFDSSGRPLAGGELCSFDSGTSTPRATYVDATLTTQNQQCAALDASGRVSIWLDPARTYRFVLKDSVGVTQWTADGIPGSGGGSGTGGGGGGGGGGGTGSFWTQNGSTIYNNVLGSKVCIAPTVCGTALAQLDVVGASSGSTHIIRIDDTANNPGIDLYGSGGSYQGSYLSGAAGLRLRSFDGFDQVTVLPGNVTVQNSGTASTTLNIKNSSTQGTANLLQFQSAAGSNLAAVDKNGGGFFYAIQANTGLGLLNEVESLTGGLRGKYLTATDSLFFIGEPVPALPSTNQARIYFDNTTTPHALYVSIDGAAYTPLGSGGGGGSSLFSAIGTGTNTSATMTVGAGGTLTFASTGLVNASKINSTSIPTSPAADMVLITTAAGVGAWSGASLNTTGLANCLDSGGNHLNYNTSTHQFSCGTTGGTVGSVSFSAITGSTNTTAAMIVGSGASLDFTGTGLISANLFNNGVAPVSGSVWKSNGSLQPVATTAPDIVAMFSGGDGCSGSNSLAADGTCRSSSGAGVFLPLAGGTMAGSILFNPSIDIGSASFPARHGFFGGTVEGTRTRTILGTPSSITDLFDWVISGVHLMDLVNSTGLLVARFDDAQHLYSFNGSLLPTFSGTYDLGTGSPSTDRWRKAWLQDADLSGNLLVSGGATFLGIMATHGILNTGSNFIITPNLSVSATAQFVGGLSIAGGIIDASSLNGALNINGSTTTNGNIVLNPGNIAGLSNVQVNGRSGGNPTTLALIVNESGGTPGSGITMKHSGGFDAAWQAGSSAAFDVVSNDTVSHRFIVYHNGHVQIGSFTPVSCSASAGTCSMTGGSNDVRGSFILSTGPSTATITFGVAFTSAPFCVASTWGGSAGVSSVGTTFIQVTANIAGGLISYHCLQ